uniref:Ground-like domain-containing protein n=1 Tax=Heterorhabditis bacteriophora TaxID=37862 RepID=A0A1I7WH99_HETBA
MLILLVLLSPLSLCMNNYAPPAYTPNYPPYQNYRGRGCSTKKVKCGPPINRGCSMGIQCPTAFPPQPCPPCPTPPPPTVCENIACPTITCPTHNKSVNSAKYDNAKNALAEVNDNFKDEELKCISILWILLNFTSYHYSSLNCLLGICLTSSYLDIIKNSMYNADRQRVTRRLHTRAHATPILSLIMRLENKCNNEDLKRIMQQSINNNIVSAKISIVERASREIGGQFDVVCTNGIFSYYAVARMFCEVTVNEISCFAFRHDDISGQFPSMPMVELEEKDKAADIPTRDPAFSLLDETKTIMSRPSHSMLTDSDASKDQRGTSSSVERNFMRRVGQNVVDMFDSSLQLLSDEHLEEFPLPENNQRQFSVDPNLQNFREESVDEINKNKISDTKRNGSMIYTPTCFRETSFYTMVPLFDLHSSSLSMPFNLHRRFVEVF